VVASKLDRKRGGVRLVVRWGLCPVACLAEKSTNVCRRRVEIHRLLANAWPKDYIHVEEKVATGDWSDAKAPMTSMKRLQTQMAKIGSGGIEVKFMDFDPACVGGRSATRNKSKHSGSAVLHALLGSSIAKRTTQERTLQIVQGRHVRLNFRYNP
jgi:hypothetical protein